MKIANLLRRFSFEEWGGTETAVWNASKIIAQTCDVELISTDALAKCKNQTLENINIKRFPYFYPQLFLNKKNKIELDKKGGNPFSYKIYKELLNGNYDIIHSHAMGRLAKEARKAALKKNIPYIISFHGGNYDVPQSEFDEMAKPLKGSFGYGKIIEKLFALDCDVVKEANGIICVGENEYKEIKKRFPDKHAAYIPNGVNAKKFERNCSVNFRKNYGIESDKKLLLCVSRIDYQKNQLALVKLVKNLLDKGENVHCAIIGFVTSSNYFKQIKDDISKFGLEKNFTLIEGLAPDSDMLISAYQSADIFVLPSVHEPFGIVALEAWSSGLPLIASAVGGLKTLVEDGKTGYLFNPNSESEILQAYYNALKNKDKICSAAKILANEKYSWEAVCKKIVNFYDEVINAKK